MKENNQNDILLSMKNKETTQENQEKTSENTRELTKEEEDLIWIWDGTYDNYELEKANLQGNLHIWEEEWQEHFECKRNYKNTQETIWTGDKTTTVIRNCTPNQLLDP